jgi:hypothetical protein
LCQEAHIDAKRDRHDLPPLYNKTWTLMDVERVQ